MTNRISVVLTGVVCGAVVLALGLATRSTSVWPRSVVASGLGTSRKDSARSAEMDAYCTERGKEHLYEGEKLAKIEAFYSWKIHTCVQIEIDGNEASWSYDLIDVSSGFLRGSQAVTSEIPLGVYDHEDYGRASAEGFWVSTETSKDKQLIPQIAAEIVCTRSEKTCRENDAALFMGLLQPQSEEYEISTWNRTGIVADDTDEGPCAIGHRLSINFASNSVTVTDYPKKSGGGADCKVFQTANAYSLHGGSIGIMGQNRIFSCDKDGANGAILTKVDQYHGHVADKSYSLWMDNGENGLPATVKTPDHSYSRNDCERLMNKKLAELRME